MAPKKKPTVTKSQMKYRPTMEATRLTAQGKKPLPDPTTIQHIILMMIMHVCKRVIFVDTSVKVGVYGGALFVGSMIADFMPIPKSYMARSDNFFNTYFVKWGWGWTFLMVGAFMLLTSYVYCCGERNRVAKHMMRLFIGTVIWWSWIRIFNYIEYTYGMCSVKGEKFQSKNKCLHGGYVWIGLDLSGHAFLLIYCNLMMIEEARVINGWEGIRDMVRSEEYNRSSAEDKEEPTALCALSEEQFGVVKQHYDKFTPYVRGLFISMSLLLVLWDVMLFGTILYYHMMVEKFLSGAVAILTWFFTYKFWYTNPNISPGLPGDGLFKYIRTGEAATLKRKESLKHQMREKRERKDKDELGLPKFMGMPLYGLRNAEKENGDGGVPATNSANLPPNSTKED